MAFLEYSPIYPLFHYTGFRAFKNIAASGKFWLSDLKCSNDPREFNFPREEMVAAFWRYDRKELPPEPRQLLNVIISDLVGALKGQSVYSFCLTSERDNLVMWKEYTREEEALSFSIRPRALRDMPLRIQKVEYVEIGDTSRFDAVAELQLDKLRFQTERNFELEKRIEIVTSMLSAIYSTKHTSWKYEKEVRLTFASSKRNDSNKHIPLSSNPDESDYPYSEPLTRNQGELDIDYYEIPYGYYKDGKYDNSKAISDIIIGPNSLITEGEIDSFMRGIGMSGYNISKSNCAFR